MPASGPPTASRLASSTIGGFLFPAGRRPSPAAPVRCPRSARRFSALLVQFERPPVAGVSFMRVFTSAGLGSPSAAATTGRSAVAGLRGPSGTDNRNQAWPNRPIRLPAGRRSWPGSGRRPVRVGRTHIAGPGRRPAARETRLRAVRLRGAVQARKWGQRQRLREQTRPAPL